VNRDGGRGGSPHTGVGASVGGTTQREVVWERCEREGKENEEVMRGPAARRSRIGRSQFELVMGGGMLSLGLAAGGPLQTLKRERGTEKRPVDNGITSQDSYLLLATK